MRCHRRLLNISYKDHVTNEEVRNRIQNATGVHDDLTMVKKRKETETQMVWPYLKILWHGEDNSARDSETSKKERKTEEEMGRYIKEWTGMGFGDSLRAAEDREGWKGIVATSSVVPRRPPRLRD